MNNVDVMADTWWYFLCCVENAHFLLTHSISLSISLFLPSLFNFLNFLGKNSILTEVKMIYIFLFVIEGKAIIKDQITNYERARIHIQNCCSFCFLFCFVKRWCYNLNTKFIAINTKNNPWNILFLTLTCTKKWIKCSDSIRKCTFKYLTLNIVLIFHSWCRIVFQMCTRYNVRYTRYKDGKLPKLASIVALFALDTC